MPTISVITVCKNDLEGLQRTYESVREQTVTPLEWIVVDAASTDGCATWLSEQNWACLSWTSEVDRGLYDGMNKGIQRASGQYVHFMNSGDIFYAPTTLESLEAAAALYPNAIVIYGDCADRAANGTILVKNARKPSWIPLGMPAHHQAMMYKRESLDGGYSLEYRLSADYALNCRLYRTYGGKSFVRIDEVLCVFAPGGVSFTQRLAALAEDYRIRRTVLCLPRPACVALYLLHRAHHLVKRYANMAYRTYRYRGNS